MTNTVKGSAWGFYIHWPGFVIKENSRFKTWTCILYSTSADLHKKVISSCSCSLPHSPQLNPHGRLQLESGEGTAGGGLPGAHSPQMGTISPKQWICPAQSAWEPEKHHKHEHHREHSAIQRWKPPKQHSHGSLLGTEILGSKPTSYFLVFFTSSPICFEAHLKSLDWNPISSPRVGWGF